MVLNTKGYAVRKDEIFSFLDKLSKKTTVASEHIEIAYDLDKTQAQKLYKEWRND